VNHAVRQVADGAAHERLLDTTVIARLQSEWSLLCHRPSSMRRARGWDLGVQFSSLPELVALAGREPSKHVPSVVGGPGGLPDPEALLARLVRLAAGDELAMRVVLQRLMPGLVAAARRRVGASQVDGFDEILAAAFTVVRCDGGEQRPHLAARLVRSAEYHAFVRPHRLSGATPPQMAEALQVSVRTVTNHRHALVHRLRQVALAAA